MDSSKKRKSTFWVAFAVMFLGVFAGVSVAEEKVASKVVFDQSVEPYNVKEASWKTYTGTAILPDTIKTARLQLNWYVAEPKISEYSKYNQKTYQNVNDVKNGDRFSVKAFWPGIRTNDTVVNLYVGANLIDQTTGKALMKQGVGTGSYWYPRFGISSNNEQSPLIGEWHLHCDVYEGQWQNHSEKTIYTYDAQIKLEMNDGKLKCQIYDPNAKISYIGIADKYDSEKIIFNCYRGEVSPENRDGGFVLEFSKDKNSFTGGWNLTTNNEPVVRYVAMRAIKINK